MSSKRHCGHDVRYLHVEGDGGHHVDEELDRGAGAEHGDVEVHVGIEPGQQSRSYIKSQGTNKKNECVQEGLTCRGPGGR